jgi:cell wall-associated NlpC family hydrolase
LLLGGVILLPAGCISAVALTGGSVAAATSTCWQPTPTPSTTPTAGDPSGARPSASAEPTWCDDPPPLGSGIPIDPGTIAAPNPAAATAVAAALTAVGRGGRYVPEGNGPVDFDCSGLTSYAWRAAGVHLVDYSFTQWDQTQRIPRSALAPGDLVFWFGGDVHHVAIVTAVDGGQVTIAEAANPTDGIRTRLLGGGWDDAYLSGFGRVVVA